jgi:hypothetical protein
MTARGWEEVEKAKADGRWERAYAGPATIQPPREFLDAIAEVPVAQTMWESLNSRNRFAMCFHLANLKTEAGRQKKIAAYVDMLASGQTIHPQKDRRAPSKKSNDAPKRAAISKKKSTSSVAKQPASAKGTRRSSRLRG